MIAGYVWDSGADRPRELTVGDDMVELLAQKQNFWLDLADPTPAEYSLLADVFAFHPLAIEDCMHYSQRPKIEQYHDHLFMVTHMVRNISETDMDLPEVDLFVRPWYVVTVHQDQLLLMGVRRRCLEDPKLASGNVDFVVHAILDTLMDSYFPVLDHCNDNIDAIEDTIIMGSDGVLTEQIVTVRRILLKLQHRVNPQVDILAALAQQHHAFVGDAAAPYFRDVYDHASRVSQQLSHYRELLGHTFEMSLAEAAHKTNDVMRRLTVLSTFFLPLTFIVGVYGMNFRYMPELGWRYGYLAIWTVMLVLAAGMWISFHRQKWL